MIVAVKGVLVSSTPVSAVVECGGIFYGINIPVTTAERLPPHGSEVLLYTVAVYREDSQTLYGFASPEDRDFFKLVVEKVSGVGPKIALNAMSRMSLSTLSDAVASGDVAMLAKCPGIGRKTAERMVLELRGFVSPAAGPGGPALSGADSASGNSNSSDAVAALVALGLKLPDADKAVRAALLKLGPEAPTEALVKAAFTS